MGKVIGIITARMTSSRLPGKVMMEICGKSLFQHHVERMNCVKGIDGIFLATSKDIKNEILIEEAEKLNCGWYSGAEEDIVERHIHLCESEDADAVIRVTCDCPLFNINTTSQFIAEFKKEYFDFIFCSNMSTMYGTLSELISYKALLKIHQSYHGPAISLPIRENPEKYKIFGLNIDNNLYRPEYRLTVDEQVDFDLINLIYQNLYSGKPLTLSQVYRWLDDNPEIAYINRDAQIKGVNLYNANLVENPIYSIVKKGTNYIILDEKKKPVSFTEFHEEIKKLFPELL